MQEARPVPREPTLSDGARFLGCGKVGFIKPVRVRRVQGPNTSLQVDGPDGPPPELER